MSKTEDTIRSLVDDLTPTGRPPNVGRSALAWCFASLLLTAAVMALVQPYRPGFISQLVEFPRFAIETLLGLAACAGIARAAFACGIPDVRAHWRRARVPLLILAAWLGLFVFALLSPVLPASTAGERPFCFFEIFVYAAPQTVGGLLLVRRMLPLQPNVTGAWMGFAAGLLPGLLMQLACMHDPVHNILWHLLPTAGAGVVGALLGRWLLGK
jgi:hypothetical protein